MAQSLVDRLTAAEADAEAADSTVGEIWDELVDLDDKSSKAELLEAVEECMDLMIEYDPDQFAYEEAAEEDESEAA